MSGLGVFQASGFVDLISVWGGVRLLGVVFVHGVRSSAGVWDQFASVMAGDEELSAVVAEPVPRFEYATGVWRSSFKPLTAIPSVSTAADSLKEYLVTEAGGFEHLVLVGHSQGGLVIQRCLVRMLAEGRGLELARVRRVVLLATPNNGSDLFLSVRRTLVRGNPQEAGLRPFDELVADTLTVLRRDIVDAPEVPTARSCRIPFSVFAGETDTVVTRASAQAAFLDAAVLPGDHFTIAKPDSAGHRTYATVRRLLMQAATEGPDPPTGADTVTTLGPARLEVHNAADPAAPQAGRIPELTAYLPRTHDDRLRGVLGDVLSGGPSRLVMLTGESSTGKTRALYEALIALAPHSPLLHPVDARDLVEMLAAGRVRPGCVLWLNEAQRFLYGPDGHEAAGKLRAVISATAGIAAVGTLWNTPYWNELTNPVPSRSYDQAKALLTQPALAVRIDVPAHLDAEDLNAWRQHAQSGSDQRLNQALTAGIADGRVVQHLSGGPELVAAYFADDQGGQLFTAAEHALITAALDARRLGYRGPLPGALLAAAADGNLAPRHRSPDPDWARAALNALATGRRADGTHTSIRSTLTALTAVYTRSGAVPAYEPADYLHQQCRSMRAEQYGTPALWTALIGHATRPDEQAVLGQAAWDRGLRTTAVRLWYKAATAGYPISGLAELGDELDPGRHGAMYSATHADLSNTKALRSILFHLHRTRAEKAFTVLSDRIAANVDVTDPAAAQLLLFDLHRSNARNALVVLADRVAAHTDLTDPYEVGILLERLGQVRAEQATTALLARDPAARVDLNRPGAVAKLLQTLRELGAEQDTAVLLARDPAAHVDLTQPSFVASLLDELQKAGAVQAYAALANRAATDADVSSPYSVPDLLAELRKARAERAFTILANRAAAHIELSRPGDGARLFQELREARAEQAITILAERAAAYSDFTKPWQAASLLDALREAGAEEAVTAFAGRAVDHTDIADPNAVTWLLSALWKAKAESAIEALLARDPATHVDLTESVYLLLANLREVGADHAFVVLAERAAAHTDLSQPAAGLLLSELHRGKAEAAIAILLDRNPAESLDLTNIDPLTASVLLKTLREVGAEQAATVLETRAAVGANLADRRMVPFLYENLKKAEAERAAALFLERGKNAGIYPDQFAPHGREPDGTPSRPWTFESIITMP